SAQTQTAVLASCVIGYPYASSEPRTSVVFNESGVLRAFKPAIATTGDRLMVFYNDEHALALGVRRVIVKTTAGTTTTDYPVSPLLSIPGSQANPDVGTTALTGDQAGTDVSARPLFPALFITDVTLNPMDMSGDWQFGGTPTPPDAVYGTWKAAVRTVDKRGSTPIVTLALEDDPAQN